LETASTAKQVLSIINRARAKNKISIVVTGDSNLSSKGVIPRPIGGTYLKHIANVIVYDYCGLKFNSGNVDIWILMAYIFHKNLAFVDDFRPSLQELMKEVSEKKSRISLKRLISYNSIFR
jgi:hypothetical protein